CISLGRRTVWCHCNTSSRFTGSRLIGDLLDGSIVESTLRVECLLEHLIYIRVKLRHGAHAFALELPEPVRKPRANSANGLTERKNEISRWIPFYVTTSTTAHIMPPCENWPRL